MHRQQWLYGMGIMACALAQPDKNFSIALDESSSGLTHRRMATNFLSRYSMIGCTRSTTASSRQRTSTSTTRQQEFLRKDAGAFTASACRRQF